GTFVDKLVGAGKRLLTGESLFMTVFTHMGSGKARVAFAAPFPGTIIPLSLSSVGGTLICQKDSFLAAAKGVSIGIHFQRRILTGLFGGEGFIMEKLEGDGQVFMHAGGTVVERQLGAGVDAVVAVLAPRRADAPGGDAARARSRGRLGARPARRPAPRRPQLLTTGAR
ncbi:MAG: hypothetical protein H6Q02_1325, partial [Acidobacteria bacterium]|nr:hypothetical protein [Acidobacteriota bacterium]